MNEKLLDKEKEYKKKEEKLKKLNDEYTSKVKLLTEQNKRFIEEKSKLEQSKCKTKHNGIKCQKCFKEPIIGYRYKCYICNNYNLCEDCEESNSLSGDHHHYFLKIRDELKDDNTNLIENDIDNYSYTLLNTKLKNYIYKGNDEAVITICLRNDKNKWPEKNTRLILDTKNSDIICDDIILKPQDKDVQETYDIKFINLKNLDLGEYKAYFYFNVYGNNYGEKICLSVQVMNRLNDNNNDHIDKSKVVKDFRDKYKIKKFEDDFIYKKLKENNFEFEPTFFKLYFS